jgi:hypothetical protein
MFPRRLSFQEFGDLCVALRADIEPTPGEGHRFGRDILRPGRDDGVLAVHDQSHGGQDGMDLVGWAVARSLKTVERVPEWLKSSLRELRRHLENNPMEGVFRQGDEELFELGDAVHGVVGHGDVDDLDLFGDVGPRAEDAPGGHADGASAGLERFEHGGKAVDSYDQPGLLGQAEARSTSAHPYIEHSASWRERLERLVPRRPVRSVGRVVGSPPEARGL